jgi:hypothetical protein
MNDLNFIEDAFVTIRIRVGMRHAQHTPYGTGGRVAVGHRTRRAVVAPGYTRLSELLGLLYSLEDIGRAGVDENEEINAVVMSMTDRSGQVRNDDLGCWKV